MTQRSLSDFHRIYNDCFYCGRPIDILNDEIICFGYLSYKHGGSGYTYMIDWVDYRTICYGCYTSTKGIQPCPFGAYVLTFEEYKKFVYLSKLL